MKNNFVSAASAASPAVLHPVGWVSVLWDDPVNLESYITRILQELFGYKNLQVKILLKELKEKGRVVISQGVRERMEADVLALHSYGLKATLEVNEKK